MTPTAAPKTAAPAPAAAPASTAAPVAPAAAPAGDLNVTQPWAVVSAYYGDIESGDYAGAWPLLDSGMTTGQTYQQFVDGYACTGSEDLSENWASGDPGQLRPGRDRQLLRRGHVSPGPTPSKAV